MSLSSSHKKRLRQIGHALHPIVTVTEKGISDGVRDELNRALDDHELIKVKLTVADRGQKQSLKDEICREAGAECVQMIGHILLLYRAAKEPNPRLSNISRAQSDS